MVESLECQIQKCAPIFISELNDDITITDNHSIVNIFLLHAYSNMHYMHLPLYLVGRKTLPDCFTIGPKSGQYGYILILGQSHEPQRSLATTSYAYVQNSRLQPLSGHSSLLERYRLNTGLPNKACTWFGEVCSCSLSKGRNKVHLSQKSQ